MTIEELNDTVYKFSKYYSSEICKHIVFRNFNVVCVRSVKDLKISCPLIVTQTELENNNSDKVEQFLKMRLIDNLYNMRESLNDEICKLERIEL